VPEPAADHVDLDAGLEEVDGGGVSEDVRANFLLQPCGLRESLHEFADAALAKRLDRIDRDRGTAGNRLFYMAVPPELHAEIVRRGPYAYVTDLGLSRNGTRVNGRLVARRVLDDGDVLTFGSARCRS